MLQCRFQEHAGLAGRAECLFKGPGGVCKAVLLTAASDQAWYCPPSDMNRLAYAVAQPLLHIPSPTDAFAMKVDCLFQVLNLFLQGVLQGTMEAPAWGHCSGPPVLVRSLPGLWSWMKMNCLSDAGCSLARACETLSSTDQQNISSNTAIHGSGNIP